ncbi:TauD/TfdA family dioxygenase, partial [Streptomyces sp. NPDC058459]|uniref:TauD/TfdA family dioxygenase n=1 Tax=Streptomyces sp. NPDC058459 TaxID=3346508 RepID=UPI003645FCFD
MRNAVTFDELVVAADKVTVTFDSIPPQAVRVHDVTHLPYPEATEIVHRYERHGFAVIELVSDAPSPESLMHLARVLGLGEPFIPPLYSLGGAQPKSVSRISAARNVDTVDAEHPSFGATVGQELHTDGTLQDIGMVKASLLVCEMAAAEGGQTTLFNTSAAFATLVERDPSAAVALATPGTLMRQANINGSTDSNAGPVVTVLEGHLVCRYSVTATDFWAFPDGVDDCARKRGQAEQHPGPPPPPPHPPPRRETAGPAHFFEKNPL